MSDESAATTVTVEPREPEEQEPAGDEAEPDWKSKFDEATKHSRKWEDRAKKDEADARAWREQQDSLKSKEDQIADREKVANERAEAAERRLAIRDASEGLEFTKEQREQFEELLEGIPTDSIAEKAERIASLIAKPTSTGPKPDPNQGRAGSPAKSGDWLRDRLNS